MSGSPLSYRSLSPDVVEKRNCRLWKASISSCVVFLFIELIATLHFQRSDNSNSLFGHDFFAQVILFALFWPFVIFLVAGFRRLLINGLYVRTFCTSYPRIHKILEFGFLFPMSLPLGMRFVTTEHLWLTGGFWSYYTTFVMNVFYLPVVFGTALPVGYVIMFAPEWLFSLTYVSSAASVSYAFATWNFRFWSSIDRDMFDAFVVPRTSLCLRDLLDPALPFLSDEAAQRLLVAAVSHDRV
jgi:hypothetical protein